MHIDLENSATHMTTEVKLLRLSQLDHVFNAIAFQEKSSK